MANKALATRQKLHFRVEPSQSKPRNPFAALAKGRVAGPHEQSRRSERQQAKRLIAKAKLKPED